jgi:phosphoserine phosphatase
MKIRSVCFDMDGTLIRNTNSVRYICELNGNLDALEEIEALENRGKISWIEADHLKAPLIEGLALASVESEFGRRIELIQNIEPVLAHLKARRMSSVLITAGPIQVANVLATEFDFDAAYGSEYEVRGTRFTGQMTNHLGNGGKLKCLRAFAEKHGIPLENCVAIGDSESDIEVFEACGRSIAINYSDAAAEVASVCIITEDIADILEILESWLSE